MAALKAYVGYTARIISPDCSEQAKCFDNLDDAKDWAEQQSTQDGDKVQIDHSRDGGDGLSAIVSPIFELIEERWERPIPYEIGDDSEGHSSG